MGNEKRHIHNTKKTASLFAKRVIRGYIVVKSNLILEKDWAGMFCNLPDADAGKLIKAAFMCHDGEDVEIEDPVLGAVFSMISDKIRENEEKYERKCAQNAKNRSASDTKVNEPKRPSTTVNDRQRSGGKEKVKEKEKVKDNNKLPFGEYGNVRMSASEYDKLSAEFGQDRTDQAVKYLDEYIGDKGYKSKSHYLAIRRWVFDALDEKRTKPPNRKPPGTKFQNFPARQDQEHKDMVARLIAMQ